MAKYQVKKSKVYFETWQVYLNGMLHKSGVYFTDKKKAQEYVKTLPKITTEQEQSKGRD